MKNALLHLGPASGYTSRRVVLKKVVGAAGLQTDTVLADTKVDGGTTLVQISHIPDNIPVEVTLTDTSSGGVQSTTDVLNFLSVPQMPGSSSGDRLSLLLVEPDSASSGSTSISSVAGSATTSVGRTVVADANYTLKTADTLVAYTSISADRTVTVDPTALTLNKVYTVQDETGNLAGNGNVIKLSLTSGGITNRRVSGSHTFGMFGGPIIVSNGGSVSFYTPDNTNIIVTHENVVQTFYGKGGDNSTTKCVVFGCGPVDPVNFDAIYDEAGSSGFLMVWALGPPGTSGSKSGACMYTSGVGQPVTTFYGVSVIVFDLSACVLLCGTILDGGQLPCIDVDNRGLLGSDGTTYSLLWDTAKVGFYGTAAISKPTVTGAKAGNAALTSLVTALKTLGLITDSTT